MQHNLCDILVSSGVLTDEFSWPLEEKGKMIDLMMH